MTSENVHNFKPPETVRPGFVLWRGMERNGGLQRAATSALVLLFTWLFSKPKAASKYVQLYTGRGYDVLQISSQLSHFLWPPNSKTFAVETAGVLKQHFADYDNFLVHAMSIGAYNYTTCMMLASERPDLRPYFIGKVRACVMDSLTLGSLDHMIRGIATGVSRRAVVRNATVCTANIYFALTRKHTVDAFNEAVAYFKRHPVQVPTLVFGCKNDPMSDVVALEGMVKDWKVRDTFPVTFQLWEKSGHCAHLQQHKEEYMRLVDQFLTSLNFDPPDSGAILQGPSAKSKL